MSKGPGRVEREIEAAFRAKPDGTYTVSELCRYVYDVGAVTKVHRIAVHRALRNVLARNPDWSSGRTTRRNHPFGPGGNERMYYNRRSRASMKEARVLSGSIKDEDVARERYSAHHDGARRV
jgi:hypothetical protein